MYGLENKDLSSFQSFRFLKHFWNKMIKNSFSSLIVEKSWEDTFGLKKNSWKTFCIWRVKIFIKIQAFPKKIKFQ